MCTVPITAGEIWFINVHSIHYCTGDAIYQCTQFILLQTRGDLSMCTIYITAEEVGFFSVYCHDMYNCRWDVCTVYTDARGNTWLINVHSVYCCTGRYVTYQCAQCILLYRETWFISMHSVYCCMGRYVIYQCAHHSEIAHNPRIISLTTDRNSVWQEQFGVTALWIATNTNRHYNALS